MTRVSRRGWGIGLGLIGLLVLAACSGTQTPAANQPTKDVSTTQPGTNPTQFESNMREDGQGAVTVRVTPLNLNNASTTLDFAVVLDTHTVDLSMDLTQLAVLKADTGVMVNASVWPVGSGHHYEATLSFPAMTPEGASVLEGATTLTLIIKDVDAPERTFEWTLNP